MNEVGPIDRRIVVSQRIRQEFDNGKESYQLEGRKILEPVEPWAKPSSECLEYHAYSKFKKSPEGLMGAFLTPVTVKLAVKPAEVQAA